MWPNPKFTADLVTFTEKILNIELQFLCAVFVLSFQNETQRISHKRYYLLTREMKNYNIMIDGQNFLIRQ